MIMKELRKKVPPQIERGIKFLYYTIPIQFRYGRAFLETYNFLQRSQWWSREKLEEYQMEQLSKLLQHAYNNVPYYRRLFDERGLKPKDVKDFNDLTKLPYLTKEDVRKNLKDLIATNIPKESITYETTGGTSGKPLGLYIERSAPITIQAFEWRQWNWMGYKFGDKCLVLRGHVIKRKGNSNPAWWEYNRDKKYLILSSYDMTDENLRKYVQKIEEFNPKVIRGYPSTLEVLARFIRGNDLIINAKGNIKAISTSSENLYQGQRKLIEEVFQCPIYDKYGNSEQTGIWGECEKHEGYHEFREFSYTEILDKEGRPINKEGKMGEMVSTGFINYAMPLIRYRIRDFVEYTNHKCSCGRSLPLIRGIVGREREFIVADDGGLISLTPIYFAIHDFEWTKVKQIQFIQREKGKLIIQIVKSRQYSKENVEKYVLDLFRMRFRNRVKLRVKFVEGIPRTKSGKHKYLIQKLPINNSD